jgi:hypothetical protein
VTRRDVATLQSQPRRDAVYRQRAVEGAGKGQEPAGRVGEAGDDAGQHSGTLPGRHDGHVRVAQVLQQAWVVADVTQSTRRVACKRAPTVARASADLRNRPINATGLR